VVQVAAQVAIADPVVAVAARAVTTATVRPKSALKAN
jgi:hypothetical protein